MLLFKQTDYLKFRFTPHSIAIHPSEPAASCNALFVSYDPSPYFPNIDYLKTCFNYIAHNANIEKIHLNNRCGDYLKWVPAPINDKIQEVFSLFQNKKNLKIIIELFDLNDLKTQKAITQLLESNPGSEIIEYELCAMPKTYLLPQIGLFSKFNAPSPYALTELQSSLIKGFVGF